MLKETEGEEANVRMIGDQILEKMIEASGRNKLGEGEVLQERRNIGGDPYENCFALSPDSGWGYNQCRF